MRSRSIAWRLALAFALVCALVLSAIGVFLYRSLDSEIAYRDDLALLGRLEQVRALLADSDSLDALQARPRLYQNMLGNLDSLLLVRRADGSNVIAINPRQRDLPPLNAIAREQMPQRRDVLIWQAPDGADRETMRPGLADGPRGRAARPMRDLKCLFREVKRPVGRGVCGTLGALQNPPESPPDPAPPDLSRPGELWPGSRPETL